MILRKLTDQLGREVIVLGQPQRIISLVPSQTELLFDLGLSDRVVGITKFCIHPEEWFRNKARVGGTKDVKVDIVRSLYPDLIIANREENMQAQADALAQEFPVWVSDVNDLPTALEMIVSIAEVTGTVAKGEKIIDIISQRFNGITPEKKRTSVYLIWKNPYMAAGAGTFINDMMQRCGLRNLVPELRYPALTEIQLQELNPELVLLSSEPFPFQAKHVEELRTLLPDAKVMLVDGKLFSWYGSRLCHSPSHFQTLMALW